MKILILILFASSFIPINVVRASTNITVAFLQLKTPDGQVLQFEKNGQFAHTAISYRGQWLQAHPYRGVEVVSYAKLNEMGSITKLVTVSDVPELTPDRVEKLIGKPFDRYFSWDDDRYYCSELVGKLLNLEPEPMSFDADYWPPDYQKYQDQPGLSPDDIYRLLREKGMKERPPPQ